MRAAHFSFRRLSATGLVLLISMSACLVFGMEPATETEPASATKSAHKQTINRILADEAFNQTETTSGWRLKSRETGDTDNTIPEWLTDLIEFLGHLMSDTDDLSEGAKWLAGIIELLLWILLAGIIVYLMYHFRMPIQTFANQLLNRENTGPVVPTHIAGLDITKDSLPDDVVTSAMALWNQKHFREALGLLYRASLSRLVHDYHCPLFASYTEQECLQAAKQLQQAALFRLMKRLTQYWLQLAYGHKTIASDHFEALCRQWQQTFMSEHSHA